MSFFTILFTSIGAIFALAVIVATISTISDNKYLASLSPEERAEEMARRMKMKEANDLKLATAYLEETYGVKVPAVICPHCGKQGFVSRKDTTRITKNRVNSIPGRVIGLGSNSETNVTKMHCMNCTMDWEV